jgi:hypothetical protein
MTTSERKVIPVIDRVYGHQWNDGMRFMIDSTTEADARKRYVDGPWFSVAIGEGLLISPAQSRAAEAAGQVRPIPEFSLELMPGATTIKSFFYDDEGSVKAIYRWHPEDGCLFLRDVIIYTYPEEPRFYGQNESLFIDSFRFHLDSTSREEHTDMTTRVVNATDRRNVDLTKNFEPIPVFGDWAGLGRADRSHRATQP